jgi:hypothetical protein
MLDVPIPILIARILNLNFFYSDWQPETPALKQKSITGASSAGTGDGVSFLGEIDRALKV